MVNSDIEKEKKELEKLKEENLKLNAELKETQDDEKLDTILKMFGEEKTTEVFNAIDLALNDVITSVKPSPYEVEIALKLIELKLRDLEIRSAQASAEEYIPTEETDSTKGMYK